MLLPLSVLDRFLPADQPLANAALPELSRTPFAAEMLGSKTINAEGVRA